MRGTILRLKRTNFDYSSTDENSGEECQNPKSLPNNFNLVEKGDLATDINKSLLLTKLDLCSSSSLADTHSEVNKSSPFKCSEFDWNNDSMWKAMSRHPLFTKYMQLQSQVSKLFEEIRLDCKKAACEKAFASLLKENGESPIESTNIVMQPKSPVETPAKKKGRPLKKRPGRPRKEDCNAEWNAGTGPQNKHLRKCRDELFLSRKPSWICQNCAKRFSSAGWLDRHKSVCSFSKMSHTDDVNTEPLEPPVISKDSYDRNYALSTPLETSLSPNRSSRAKGRAELSPSSPLPQHMQNVCVSPLQPKLENLNFPEEEESQRKAQFSEATNCVDEEDSSVTCTKCSQEFGAQAFKRHLEEYPECKIYASIHDGDSGDYSSNSSVAACKHCGKTFTREKILKRHQNLCHMNSKGRIFQCIKCLKTFSRQTHYEQHQSECIMGKRSSREGKRCENCSLIFPTQRKLLKHQAICCPDSSNHMLKLLKCLKCSMVFPSYKKQLKHRAVCCPDRDTAAKVCCYCSKVLIMRERMDAHKKKCFKSSYKLAV